MEGLRVGNKYRIDRKIGNGSFGEIYSGKRSPDETYCIARLLTCGHKVPT